MVQLQSILFPDSHVCQVEELYFHRYNQIQETERIDFDGYFNLFYIEKRKKYTQIEELSLQLTLYGYKECRGFRVLHGRLHRWPRRRNSLSGCAASRS